MHEIVTFSLGSFQINFNILQFYLFLVELGSQVELGRFWDRNAVLLLLLKFSIERVLSLFNLVFELVNSSIFLSDLTIKLTNFL
jgi:hypothetical protein